VSFTGPLQELPHRAAAPPLHRTHGRTALYPARNERRYGKKKKDGGWARKKESRKEAGDREMRTGRKNEPKKKKMAEKKCLHGQSRKGKNEEKESIKRNGPKIEKNEIWGQEENGPERKEEKEK
jgi:hypothetical protein